MRAPNAALGAAALATLALAACGKPQAPPTWPAIALPNTAVHYLGAQGSNVLPVTLGGTSLCGKQGYVNEPCTSVTVCKPGTQECQTLTDILVDTGSSGLRVFSSALSLSLAPESDPSASGNTVAECAQFGTGSDWGPVALADVMLGGEPAASVPIQIIDKGFASAPAACAHADSSPAQVGFNGILGIGPFIQDCGPACSRDARAGIYFSCGSGGNAGDGAGACQPASMGANQQVQNPVALLASDNNGLLLALPNAGQQGTASLAGALILGIDTSSDNSPSPGTLPYPLDAAGNLVTLFAGQAYPGSFIDSGSNALFFPNETGLPLCSSGGPAPGFYCPSAPREMTASNAGVSGGPATPVPFEIGNAEELLIGAHAAIPAIGGNGSGGFDWGLPFFFGRAVFVGFEGKPSSLGEGPYMAY